MTKHIAERFLLSLSKLSNYRIGQIIALSARSIESLYNLSDEDLITLIDSTFKVAEKEDIDKAPIYGKIYIHKGTEMKTIFREELQKYLALGYKLGRKDKNK